MTDQTAVTDQAIKPGHGRKILMAIVAIPAIILLLSTALYYMADNELINMGTVNNGTLISPPLRLSELALKNEQGDDYDYSLPERKWSFVVVGGENCDGICERMLYISRQAHHALERRMPKIKRIYLNHSATVSEQLQQRLAADYKSTKQLRVDKNELSQLLNNSAVSDLQENRFYVVDHNGWMMMYYEAKDVEQATLNELGKEVIKDMKRLLK